MTEFEHHYRTRGALGIFVAVLATTLATAFLWSYRSFFPLFLGMGIGCTWLAVQAWRSACTDEVWNLQIVSGVLSWSYPSRCADHAGSIPLAEVSRVTIDDGTAELRVWFKDGGEKTVRLAVNGYALYRHLELNYPHVSIDHIAPIAS